jgi:ribosomal protein S27AE
MNSNKNFKNKKPTCPKCFGNQVLDIFYGYPTAETLKAWHNREIELGGCIIGKENPTSKCAKCGYEWKFKS